MKSMNIKTTKRQKTALILLGFLLTIILLESGLRLGGFILSYLQKGNNQIAMQQEDAFRVMCIGESTTAIGGKNSYPSQLQEILNQNDIGVTFTVLNKGIIATDTTALLSLLEENLDYYDPDMVVAMMGVNDIFESDLIREECQKNKRLLFFKSLRVYKLFSMFGMHTRAKLQEVSRSLPKTVQEYFTIGREYCSQGRYQNAHMIYDKVEEEYPEAYQVYVERGSLYRLEGKHDNAEDLFREAVAWLPDNVEAYVGLGYILEDLDRYEEAKEVFAKALSLDGWDKNALLSIGRCYIKQKQYGRAVEVFKEIELIYPNSNKVHNFLATCYSALGKDGLAQQHYDRARELRFQNINMLTKENYQMAAEILKEKKIPFVCVQYPLRNIEILKYMLGSYESVLFVDNESTFKNALQKEPHEAYFTDIFAGDFGHCTPKGNRLLAQNIAKVILEEHFGGIVNEKI